MIDRPGPTWANYIQYRLRLFPAVCRRSKVYKSLEQFNFLPVISLSCPVLSDISSLPIQYATLFYPASDAVQIVAFDLLHIVLITYVPPAARLLFSLLIVLSALVKNTFIRWMLTRSAYIINEESPFQEKQARGVVECEEVGCWCYPCWVVPSFGSYCLRDRAWGWGCRDVSGEWRSKNTACIWALGLLGLVSSCSTQKMK